MYRSENKKKYVKFSFIVMGIFGLGILAFLGVKSSVALKEITIDTSKEPAEKVIGSPFSNFTPHKDPNRINILVLGLRGSVKEEGGLLSDAIVVVSLNKKTGEAALVSIPRDLYTLIPGEELQQGKINSAYAIGKTRHWDGGGLILSKAVVEFVSGLQIDHVVSVDFGAFEDVIDAMGGVEITLEEEFAERRQWRRNPEFADTGGEFILPKGRHLLSGQMALFYARSRFSSSDFERGRRIQQIALAVKKKMMELGWLKNPLSILKFIETTEKHIRTNMSFTEIKNLVSEIREYEISKQVILSTAAPAFLVEGTVNNQYILLPPESNFDKIRDIFINLF